MAGDRAVVRAGFGLAAVLLLAAALGAAPSARASGGGAPASFSAVALAAGAHYRVDSDPPLTEVDQLTDAYSPEAGASLDSSGNAGALASSFDARGAAELPALLCLAGAPCPAGFPPANPLDAQASYPSRPRASGLVSYVGQPLGVAGLLGFTPGEVTASADPGDVTSSASTSQADSYAGVPGLVGEQLPASSPALPRVTAGSVLARSHAFLSAAGALVVDSAAVATDVSIAGAVHIATLTSLASATLTGIGPPAVHVSTTATGVTVLGAEARLSDSGLKVLSAGDGGAVLAGANAVAASAAALSRQAGSALSQAGISGGLSGVRLVGDSVDRRPGGEVNAQAGGLLVTLAFLVAGVPSVGVPRPPAPVCAAASLIVPQQAPIGPCALPGVDPNAAYSGEITLAAAGLDASASAGPAAAASSGSGSAGSADAGGASPGPGAPVPGAGAGGRAGPAGTAGLAAGSTPTVAHRFDSGRLATRDIGAAVPDPARRVALLMLALCFGGVAVLGGRAAGEVARRFLPAGAPGTAPPRWSAG